MMNGTKTMGRAVQVAIATIVAISAAGLVQACKPKADPGTDGQGPGAAHAQEAAPSVEKIVFLDLKEACECTAKRTEGSWSALQAATKGLELPVERIHVDEQGVEASKYSDMKPYVAMPAVYFTGAEGKLVGMLQGEITQQQFEEMISGRQ